MLLFIAHSRTPGVRVGTLLLVSLIILVSSARLVVWGGTNLALAFGVSDLIIGLTVVALGTSLPELAVAISSALKRQHQMIIGNIIGSNLFNTLGVLAIPGLVVNPAILYFRTAGFEFV